MTCQLCGQAEAQDYDGVQLCATCAERAAAYQERLEARLDRLRKRAASAQSSGEQELARARQRADMIPFGQPILVGHHSEGRDRSFRSKIFNGFRRGYEALERAQAIQRRVNAAEENRAISSDDPLALVKLRERLAELEAKQAMMKRVNTALKKAMKMQEADGVQFLMRELLLAEDKARELLTYRDFMGRSGFASFKLTNNAANIRRVKARVAQEEQRAKAMKVLQEERQNSPAPAPAHDTDGAYMQTDLLENRTRLYFPGKPSSAIIRACKQAGFRWSPSNGAWQRHASTQAEYLAQRIIEQWKQEGTP